MDADTTEENDADAKERRDEYCADESFITSETPYADLDAFDGAVYFDVGSYHVSPREYGAGYVSGFGIGKE